MTVAEFVAFLKLQPQDLKVVFACYSEQCLLDVNDILIRDLCVARPDGWVHHKRPDKPTERYLVLPGN